VILWIGDAQFADLTQTYRFKGPDSHDHFLLRYHQATKFCPDEQAPEALARPGLLQGTDGRGRGFRQEWGWLGAAGNRKRMRVRRLTLSRPGERDVVLISSLLDPEAYPAEELLEAYLGRGSIEGVFQKITEVFGLERLISSSPKGTVFQLAFCLLLYNVVAVLCSHLAAGQGLALAEVSAEMVFEDVKEDLTALARVLASPVQQHRPAQEGGPAGQEGAAQAGEGPAGPCRGGCQGVGGEGAAGPWLSRLAALVPSGQGAQAVRGRLGELLGGRWRPIWRKAVNKGRRAHPDKPRQRIHCSVHRVLEASKSPRHPATAPPPTR
jgi:hypothetical protein